MEQELRLITRRETEREGKAKEEIKSKGMERRRILNNQVAVYLNKKWLLGTTNLYIKMTYQK